MPNPNPAHNTPARTENLQARWEKWKPHNNPGFPYYLEYWRTDEGKWFIMFRNQGFGHTLDDLEDTTIANYWRPRRLFEHLSQKYGGNKNDTSRFD